MIFSFFCPTVQIWPASGARTLLHIGTHRKEYKDLDPNHLHYMRWRLQGLVKSPFVEDVNLGEIARTTAGFAGADFGVGFED